MKEFACEHRQHAEKLKAQQEAQLRAEEQHAALMESTALQHAAQLQRLQEQHSAEQQECARCLLPFQAAALD